MAEPSLALAITDLESEIGLFLGWGRGTNGGDPAWSSSQQATITSIRKSGERQFYFPPPIDASGSSYDWSFLKPVATLTIAQSNVLLPLPDDFGGMEGQITLTATTTIVWYPIEFVGVGRVYKQAAEYPTTTGRPILCCQEPIKGTTANAGQRFRLRFWPIPDQAYTIQFAYYVNPDASTGDRPYVYGGAQHAETILASCLAVAEERLDDQIGPRNEAWMRRLAASIAKDRQSKPQKLGYNRDNSDLRLGYWDRRDQHYADTITVKGVQY
jgi:hypothetical protein